MANTAKNACLRTNFPWSGLTPNFKIPEQALIRSAYFESSTGSYKILTDSASERCSSPETSWGEISVKIDSRSESWQDWGIEKLLYFGWVAPPNIRAFYWPVKHPSKPRHIRLRTLFLESELSLNNKYKEKHPQKSPFLPPFQMPFFDFSPLANSWWFSVMHASAFLIRETKIGSSLCSVFPA